MRDEPAVELAKPTNAILWGFAPLNYWVASKELRLGVQLDMHLYPRKPSDVIATVKVLQQQLSVRQQLADLVLTIPVQGSNW